MKLLTPSQTKDLQSEEQVLKILRTQETEEAAKRANIGLARAEADFAATLANNRKRWEQEEKEHAARKKEMAEEINVLEAKRLNALIPVGILEDSVKGRMKDAVKLLADLKIREEKAEDLTETLEDKLDEVGEREETLSKKEKELTLKEQGIARQSEITSERAANLTKRMQDFEEKKAREEKELSDKKTALFLKERTLKAEADKQHRNAKAMKEWEIQLTDQRDTLARAWAELEKKNVELER